MYLDFSLLFCNYILNVVAQLIITVTGYSCSHRLSIHASTLEPAGSNAYHSVRYRYRYILLTCDYIVCEFIFTQKRCKSDFGNTNADDIVTFRPYILESTH